jgi:multidrug transporter EmrE-like cation transporter
MGEGWFPLLATILCSGGGNILANLSHSLAGHRRLAALLAAMAAQGLGLLFYTAALTGLPLAIAYPILVGGSMMVVTGTAALFFRERIGGRAIAGIALIVIGIVLLQDIEGPAAAAFDLLAGSLGVDVR